jgi:hypothetical protein
MAFRYLTDGSCPVCNGERTDCRVDGDLYFCRTDNPANKFRFLKYDAQNFGLYVTGKSTGRKVEKRQSDLIAVDAVTRNAAYGELLIQTELEDSHRKNLIARGLDEQTIDDIGFRTLSPTQKLRFINAFPGHKNGFAKVRQVGFTVPVRDVDGNVISYQLRIEDKDNKYLWAAPHYKKDKKISSHNTDEELPLQIVDKGTVVVGLCEGTLKPIIASLKHKISFIGASGGNFMSSKKTLLKTLAKLTDDYGKLQIVLFPDAGLCVADKAGRYQELDKLKKLAKWLEENKFDVYLADWGQYLKPKKEGGKDIDEFDGTYEVQQVSNLYTLGSKILSQLTRDELNDFTKVSLDGYMSMFKEQIEALCDDDQTKGIKLSWEQCLDTEVKYIPGQLPKTLPLNVVYVFEPEQRKQFYKECYVKGHTRLLDISGCGTGKSYTAGTMKATDFFPIQGGQSLKNYIANNKLIYLTQQPRNPSTTTLEENFTELPSRHVGVKYDKTHLTELGNYYRKRVKDADKADELGNCHLAEMFVAIRDKGMDENLCQTCPFISKCRKSKGADWSEDGKKAPYGYEFEKIKVLSSTSEIIASASGFTYKFMHPSSQWAGIIDEYSQTLSPIKTVEVNLSDYDKTCGALSHYDGMFITKVHNVFKHVYKVLQGYESPHYGFNNEEVLDLLNDISHDEKRDAITTVENINHERMEGIRSYLKSTRKYGVTQAHINQLEHNWLVPFFQVWSGTVNGSFHLSSGKLAIHIRNEMQKDTLNSLRFAVYQDATGTRTHLSQYLACDPSSIMMSKARVPVSKNLEIVQITGMGNPRNSNRSKTMVKRVSELRKALSAIHDRNNIGFMDYKQHALDGDLHHLSTARGANAFLRLMATCSIGIPCPSLTALEQQFTTFTRQKPEGKEFNNFVNNIRSGEMIQELGRLRAERRLEEKLTYYVVTDDKIDWLRDIGYNLTVKNCGDFTPYATKPSTQVRWKIYRAAMECIQDGDFEKISDITARASQITAAQVKRLSSFKTIKEFYAEQYLLIQDIVKEARESVEIPDIHAIIEQVTAKMQVSERQKLTDVLSLYVPGFLEAYVKEQLDDGDQAIMDEFKSMKDIYQAEWDILERYAKSRDNRRLTNKLNALPQTIQSLWREQAV